MWGSCFLTKHVLCIATPTNFSTKLYFFLGHTYSRMSQATIIIAVYRTITQFQWINIIYNTNRKYYYIIIIIICNINNRASERGKSFDVDENWSSILYTIILHWATCRVNNGEMVNWWHTHTHTCIVYIYMLIQVQRTHI